MKAKPSSSAASTSKMASAASGDLLDMQEMALSPEAQLQNALGVSADHAFKSTQKHVRPAQVSVAQAILDRFASSPWVSAMISRLGLSENPQDVVLDNLSNPSVKLLVVASVFQKSRKPVIFLAPDPHQSEKYADELGQHLQPGQVELYPTEDVSPYDLSIPAVHSLRDHHRILERLAAEERFVLIFIPQKSFVKTPFTADHRAGNPAS